MPAAPVDVLALEEVAARGWPAPDTRWLGRWLLRAAEGFTGRANSVLPLGDPGRPLDGRWPRSRPGTASAGCRRGWSIPTPAREALDAALAGRGWTAYNPTEVLTADVEITLAALPERRRPAAGGGRGDARRTTGSGRTTTAAAARCRRSDGRC